MNKLDYELIDFGGGRKLEKMGDRLIDRPSLDAQNQKKKNSARWASSNLKFSKTDQKATNGWIAAADQAHSYNSDSELAEWRIQVEDIHLELRPTPVGHVGFFPEHIQHWDWLKETRPNAKKILHLFAYTGATTLHLAKLGAEVTHVDSSKSAVYWARKNAQLSGLGEAVIRWIVEDATRYVSREIKRGNFYDGFVIDPPSYGHGTRAETWKMEPHFEPLLDQLFELTHGAPELALVTSHTEGFDSRLLKASLASRLPAGRSIDSGKMQIPSDCGRKLNAGWFARSKK